MYLSSWERAKKAFLKYHWAAMKTRKGERNLPISTPPARGICRICEANFLADMTWMLVLRWIGMVLLDCICECLCLHPF